MNMPSRTERVPTERCQSTHVSRMGTTHWCRFKRDHPDELHECICERTWAPTPKVEK